MAFKGGLRRNPLLLFEAIVLAIRVETMLRRRPMDDVRSLSGGTGGRRPMKPGPDLSPTFQRAIQLAYRLLPFQPTCLKESMVFCLYRRRRGLPAELRIGVQKHQGQFGAHAWVED